MKNLSALLLSVFITIVLIPILRKLAVRGNALDMPDSRKIHTIPIPRIGGLAIALGVLIPLLMWAPRNDFIYAYIVSGAILVIFGLVDDLKGLDYRLKFLGQVLAALIMLFYGGIRITNLGTLLSYGTVLPDLLAVVLTLLVIVGVTNAINLSDGLDGLAGGISLLGFFCIGFLAYLIQDNTVLLLSLAFVGAIFGFLRYNTYPASIFMGDTGSQLLGFSAIVLAIKVTQENVSVNPVLPLIIMGFPILDTLTVMLERMKQGRSPFLPDKNHFHHRLISIGFFHTEAVVIIYLIQSLMIISAILFRYYFAYQCFAGYLIFSALFISVFAIADRKGFRVKRYHLIDHIIKGRLANIRDKKLVIRISFEISKVLIPLIFMFSCFLPREIPGYAIYVALGFGLLIIVMRIFGKNAWSLGLRAALYLSIPLILYLSQEGIADWIKPEIMMGYHIGLAVMAFFVILTIKFSRRSKGFHVTTMDFLVLFIAIVIPNLPIDSIQSHIVGMLVVKLIVILFSYEVLITELRGEFNALTVSTLGGLAIIGVRGLM